MAWWHKVVAFPVKRACVAVAARVKPPSDGGGIIKLQNDVQMCGYQDVQVMWEMVRISEMELSNKPKKRKRLLWRLLAWLNQSSSGDPMDPH
ncbi:unnamed protein product [Musa acuminata subsp. malaccensis]|uniref:(wild Malaysian banana) hypothetical protein n=1 Tax=Musa acuminata subsp. malaccensis TaxID=214687 RepID=A0A804KMU8_MUSAM|nr:PREDICTED: uncharacterized protein LOC103998721 [Musa acuminata subsp. malaccensis]CAG1836232.1 unnamed protein product [Musa acuminata subsp. malaccensis]